MSLSTPLSNDVIGPISKATFPLHTVELIATAFFGFEVAWLIDLSDILKRPSDINARSI